jgi:type 1 glutamine amidotransferase
MQNMVNMINMKDTRPYLSLILCLLGGFLLTNCQVTTTRGAADSGVIRTLMVGGGSSHDFDRWYKQADAETLRQDEMATVRYTSHTDSIGYYLPNVDVLVLTNNQPIQDPDVRKAIFDFVNSGKGLVLGHAALWYNWADWPEYNQQLVSGGSRGHDRYGSFEVTVTQPNHPITSGVPANFTLKDELYYFKPDPAGPGIEVLATASVPGSDTSFPSVFVVKQGRGRIAGLALGHDAESHDLPAYQTLLRNAVQWAAGK